MSDEKKMTEADGLTCDIIHDLLPLYHDGILSEESKTQVEEHIAVCSECADELKSIGERLHGAKGAPNSSRRFVSMVEKNKRKRLTIFSLCFIAGAAAVCTGLYFFLHEAFVFKWDPEVFDVHYVEYYKFSSCPYAKNDMSNHAETEDDSLFVFMRAPAVKNYDFKRKDGDLEMVYTRPAFNKTVYEFGEREDIFIVPVEPGDKTFSINGKKICDIGEPKRGDGIPEVIKAYHYFNSFAESKSSWEITEPDGENGAMLTFYADDNNNEYITWDMHGELVKDNMKGDKPYMTLK